MYTENSVKFLIITPRGVNVR